MIKVVNRWNILFAGAGAAAGTATAGAAATGATWGFLAIVFFTAFLATWIL
jgi:hypothetical protein